MSSILRLSTAKPSHKEIITLAIDLTYECLCYIIVDLLQIRRRLKEFIMKRERGTKSKRFGEICFQ